MKSFNKFIKSITEDTVQSDPVIPPTQNPNVPGYAPPSSSGTAPPKPPFSPDLGWPFPNPARVREINRQRQDDLRAKRWKEVSDPNNPLYVNPNTGEPWLTPIPGGISRYIPGLLFPDEVDVFGGTDTAPEGPAGPITLDPWYANPNDPPPLWYTHPGYFPPGEGPPLQGPPPGWWNPNDPSEEGYNPNEWQYRPNPAFERGQPHDWYQWNPNSGQWERSPNHPRSQPVGNPNLPPVFAPPGLDPTRLRPPDPNRLFESNYMQNINENIKNYYKHRLFEQLKEVTILEAAPPGGGGGNSPVRPPGRGPGGIGSIFGRRLVWEDLTTEQAQDLLLRWMRTNRLSIPRPTPQLAKPLLNDAWGLEKDRTYLQVRGDGIYYQDTNGFWHYWYYDEATGQFMYKKLGDSRTFDWRGNGLGSRRRFNHYDNPNAPAHSTPNIENQGMGFGFGAGGGAYYGYEETGEEPPDSPALAPYVAT
jgi:hypothetical protein